MTAQKDNRYNYLYSLLPVAGLFFGPIGPAIGGSIAYILLLFKKDISLAKNILYLGILMSLALLILFIATNTVTNTLAKT